MYVDENVINSMNRPEFESSLMTNETIEATVAFIDICSFSAVTENEPANAVVKLLNTYFDLMVKEIISQNGHIDKFIGMLSLLFSATNSILTEPWMLVFLCAHK